MRTISVLVIFLIGVCLAKPQHHLRHQHNHHRRHFDQGLENFELSPWAKSHMDEVRLMADRLRQEFNSLGYGGSGRDAFSTFTSSSSYSPSSSAFSFTGKSQAELDSITKQLTEQMIADMKNGRLSYSQITKPNWFEQQAAMKLESLDHMRKNMQEPEVMPNNFEIENFDEVSHVTYPPNVAVIGGKRYVTRKNCTTVTSTNGNNTPVFALNGNNGGTSSNSKYEYNYNRTRKETSYPYRQVLPPDYQRTINPDFGTGNQIIITKPGSTTKVTVSHVNRTVSNGYPTVTGCRDTKVFVNGQVVFNRSQSIGSGCVTGGSSMIIESDWRRAERERLFWLLAQNSWTSEENLLQWQQRNWHLLMELAQKYRVTVEEIKEFQRSELLQYFMILNKSSFMSSFSEEWKKLEQARWDWFIQQSQINIDELQMWQQKNIAHLTQMAELYRISLQELLNWQRNEMERLRQMIIDQNTQLMMLNQWKTEVMNQFSQLKYQQNLSIQQIKELVHQQLLRLQNLSVQYHIDIESFKQWLESEQMKIIEKIRIEEENRLAEWKKFERIRIENIVKEYNASLDEIRLRLELETNHLRNLAERYRVEIEEIRRWQQEEIRRLEEEGRLRQKQLQTWQRQIQNEIKEILRQHQVTITELQEIIKRDQQQLEAMAMQYHVSVQEIKNWYKTEAERLIKLEVDSLIEEWQKNERIRIDRIISEHDYTVEELKRQLLHDRQMLNSLSANYRIRIQELEEWYEKEIQRLKELNLIKSRIENLSQWQREEHQRIVDMIKSSDFTVEDLEERLQRDFQHLYELVNRYRINKEQVLDWYKDEIRFCLNEGLIRPSENLVDWQIKEKEYISQIVRNYTFTVDELMKRLEMDREHLEHLSRQFNIEKWQIIEWYRKQIESLANRGIIQRMELLKEWQKQQREFIYKLIQDQQITLKELEARLIHDRAHLEMIAQQYRISINELANWHVQEINRLIEKGFLSQLQIKTWEEQETEKILSLIENQRLTFEQLEKLLIDNYSELQILSQRYHITIQQLQDWYRRKLMHLLDEKLIVREWHLYIRNLLEQLVNQQKYSIEELRLRFKQNIDNLRELITKYNMSLMELEQWYEAELQRLLQLGYIYVKGESMTLDWKEQERIHLKDLAKQYDLSLKLLQQNFLRNENLLRNIAFKYGITLLELQAWYDQLINEMLLRFELNNDLGGEISDWKAKEEKRLRELLINTRLSYDEIIEYLMVDDLTYSETLSLNYGISLSNLVDFQRRLIRQWLMEGKILVKLDLISLTNWQKEEREHLYKLISLEGITSSTLRNWQKLNMNVLQERSNHYITSLDKLLTWQVNELFRLEQLAKYYNMTLYELDQFRTSEIIRISQYAHRPTTSYNDFESWESGERLRIMLLMDKLKMNEESLWKWRRKLYLYCQGLLPFKPACIPNSHLGNIDKRRGDQPPQMSNECDEEEEPGLNPIIIPRPLPPTLPPPRFPPPPIISGGSSGVNIFHYERNKTEQIIGGPSSGTYVSGAEHVLEYEEESGGGSALDGGVYGGAVGSNIGSISVGGSYGGGYGGSSSVGESISGSYGSSGSSIAGSSSSSGIYGGSSSIGESIGESYGSSGSSFAGSSSSSSGYGGSSSIGESIGGTYGSSSGNYGASINEGISSSSTGGNVNSSLIGLNSFGGSNYSSGSTSGNFSGGSYSSGSYSKLDISTDKSFPDEENYNNQEYQEDQQNTEDLSQKFEDFKDNSEELTQQRVQQPSAKEFETFTQQQQMHNFGYSRQQRDRSQTSQQMPADLSQRRENFEHFDQRQQVQQQPSAKEIEDLLRQQSQEEDLGQQVVQQQQYPTQKEIEELSRQENSHRNRGYGSRTNVYSQNDGYPAKVEEVNPRLEVETFPVVTTTTKKPGFWRRIFG